MSTSMCAFVCGLCVCIYLRVCACVCMYVYVCVCVSILLVCLHMSMYVHVFVNNCEYPTEYIKHLCYNTFFKCFLNNNIISIIKKKVE